MTAHRLAIKQGLDEAQVWRIYAEPCLQGVPDNVLRICEHGFTEMINNAVDHSEGTTIDFVVTRSARKVTLTVADDGVGIFQKIKSRFNLEDKRHAILELSKGKRDRSETTFGRGYFLHVADV